MRLTTWAWTDTSSAETGSSQSRSVSDSMQVRRAIPIRWPCPPENSCGNLSRYSDRDPTSRQKVRPARFPHAPCGRRPAGGLSRPRDDRQNTHRDRGTNKGPRKIIWILLRRSSRIDGSTSRSIILPCRGHNLTDCRLDQVEGYERRGRFSAARFADEPQRSPSKMSNDTSSTAWT